MQNNITPQQDKELRKYFKKVYLFGGVDFSWWFTTLDPKWHIMTYDRELDVIWWKWMNSNGYSVDSAFQIFTEKFITEVVNENV